MTKLETFLSALLIITGLFFLVIIFGFTIQHHYPYAHDGDTIEIFDSIQHKQIGLRLANIDAPELAQPYGSNSRDSLQKLIRNCKMKIKIQSIDKYGRKVSVIYFDDKRFDSISVVNGWSYVYAAYCTCPKLYLMQNFARINKKGVWNIQPQIMPWQFRHQIK